MMTRRDQYNAFIPFLEAEEKRSLTLTQRASTFLGLTSIVTLFGGISISKLPSGSYTCICAVAAAAFVLFAVLSALQALRIRSYDSICDPAELLVSIDEDQYDEDDVYSVLLGNMAKAVRQNRDINDVRANWLQLSATCFAIAIVLIAITSLFAIHEREATPTAKTHTETKA